MHRAKTGESRDSEVVRQSAKRAALRCDEARDGDNHEKKSRNIRMRFSAASFIGERRGRSAASSRYLVGHELQEHQYAVDLLSCRYDRTQIHANKCHHYQTDDNAKLECCGDAMMGITEMELQVADSAVNGEEASVVQRMHSVGTAGVLMCLAVDWKMRQGS